MSTAHSQGKSIEEEAASPGTLDRGAWSAASIEGVAGAEGRGAAPSAPQSPRPPLRGVWWETLRVGQSGRWGQRPRWPAALPTQGRDLSPPEEAARQSQDATVNSAQTLARNWGSLSETGLSVKENAPPQVTAVAQGGIIIVGGKDRAAPEGKLCPCV